MKLVKLTDELILKYSQGREVTEVGDFNLKYGKKNSQTIVPIKGGVYDPEFFSSVYERSCNCGTVRSIGKYCHRCNCELLSVSDKLQRYAHIELPVYFITKYKIKNFVDSLGGVIKGIGTRKLGLKNKFQYLSLCHYTYDETTGNINTSTEFNGDEKYYSIEGLLKILQEHYPSLYEECRNYLNRLFIVTPAILRPISFFSSGSEKKVKVHPNSAIYQSLVYLKSFITEKLRSNIPLVDKIMYSNMLRQYCQIASANMSSINNTSKQNITRTILGKRIPNSARATIVPDIDLPIDKILIPESIAYEMYKTDFLKYLKSKYSMSESEAATLYYTASPDTLKLFNEFIDQGKSVIFNRAPTIHKYSIIGVNVGLTKDISIHMPPLLCFTEDTEFLLKDGSYISFKECKDRGVKSCEVQTSNGIHLAKNIGYRKTVTVLYEVTFTDGYKVKCDESQAFYDPYLNTFIKVTDLRESDTIQSVIRLEVDPTPVYCMEVPGVGNFKLRNGQVVKNCKGLNADFDGDALSVQAIPDEYRDYVMSRISPQRTFYMEKNLSPLFTPSHEFLYGLHLASMVKEDKPIKVKDANELEELYSNGKIDTDTKVELPKKYDIPSTYGRIRLSNIIGDSIDTILGKDVPITAKNITLVMAKINIFEDRLERLKKLQDFSMEMMRLVGITALSLKDLYVELDPEFKNSINKIIDSEELTQPQKLIKVQEIYSNYLKDNFEKDVSKKVIDMTKSSDRVKMDQLVSITLPGMVISGTGEVKVAESSIYQGLTPEDYKSHATSNRHILNIKANVVPTSGYVTRQITYIAQMYRYKEEDQPTTEYLPMKRSQMLDRYNSKGLWIDPEKYKHDNSIDYFPSCIYNEETVIYKNQIRKEFEYYDGDNIGISFGTGISESVTQSGLALKHGANLRSVVEDYKLHANSSGKVTNFSNNWLELSDGSKYPVTDKFSVINYDFKKGDTIGYVNVVMTPAYRADSMTMFLDGFSRASNRNEKNIIYKSLSVAPKDGKLTYSIEADGINISINGEWITKVPLDRYTLILHPDGHMIQKGDKITTDVLDMKLLDLSITDKYLIFRSEFQRIFQSKLTEDLIEFFFRLLYDMSEGTYSGVKGSMKKIPIMSQISFGYASNHLRKIDDTELELQGTDAYDLFTNLILGVTNRD